ncbi:XRE family transcriptional regulator [Bacillus methanolicus]|uniref:helix-turn-helix domain-containing protein n=1 Tax=Bacillus methanolicus TaxID=1471 RepID=UPI00200BFECF|nr:helix-turn-helix transcriptional regulator [Bacillus methanolicus]UQD52341.1 XRE family transcriptional regulator [Bacillus methanolicus]
MASLKDRLRELRKKHKLTQKDVAEILGISESAYGYYEQGRNEPSITTIKLLAKKYNVSPAYILGETDNPDPKETVLIAGKEIELTADDIKILEEIKKNPVLFHDLASDPEKKVKELIKLQKMKKLLLEDDDEEYGEGFGDIED